MEMGIFSKSKTFQNKDVAEDDGYATKELMGYSYGLPIFNLLIDDEECTRSKAHRAINYLNRDICQVHEYCLQEVADRLFFSSNPGTAWKVMPEVWKEFMNEQGRFDYTYPERFHDNAQLLMVIRELQENMESRRAVLSVYDPCADTELRARHLRIPCSMYYQFMIRNEGGVDKLNVIYNMRSCDFYLHWIHDVIMTMAIAIHIAKEVGVQTGMFIHQIGSFHAYKKDYESRGVF